MKATARWLIVATTICAWVAISNHCAFRAVASKTKTNQSGCPFHSKPAKAPPKSVECCKILRALAASNAKQLARAIVDLSNADPDSAQIQLVAPKICFITATLDTGPPGKTAFTELSSTIRAHAPPSLVA